MNGQISPAEHAAIRVAREAVLTPQSAYGLADTMVVALSQAGYLRDPAAAGELARMQGERSESNRTMGGLIEERARLLARLAELAPYEALHPQTCLAGLHRPWFADVDVAVDCPWCRIAELEGAAGTVFRALRGQTPLGPPYMTREAAAAHCEADLRKRHPDAMYEWSPAEDTPAVTELSVVEYGHTTASGLSVIAVAIQPGFDPEQIAPAPEASA